MTVHAKSFGALCAASALYAALSLAPLSLAQAGETITWPGNGVLGDVTIGGRTFPDSLAPSASSPSGNNVSVTGGSIGGAGESSGHVFGGWSDSSNVTGNSVVISGGNIGGGTIGGAGESSGQVTGGRSDSGTVTGNSVIISGGSIGGAGLSSGQVFGGSTIRGTVTGNSVIISGGTIGGAKRNSGQVYGGRSERGTVSNNNSVVISGGSIGGEGQDSGRVYGGWSFSGTVTGNSVVISGGSIGGAGLSSGLVYGGYSLNGSATGNSVVISGGSIGGTGDNSGQVTGGFGHGIHDRNATGNSVVISGGNIGGAGKDSGLVYGGYSYNGNATGNSVVISGGTIGGTGENSGQVFGGRGKDTATGNSVVISGGTIGGAGQNSGQVYGGRSGSGTATGNSVVISGGTIGGAGYYSGRVTGGYSDSGSVTGNSVVISGGTIGGEGQRSGQVYGGHDKSSGNVTGNSVTISGGTIGGAGDYSGCVYGGFSTDGTATGNSVTISGGTIGGAGDYSGRVIGGYGNFSGNATGNSVTISGGTIGGAGDFSGQVYGGFSFAGNATHNTVSVLGSPVFGADTQLRGGGSNNSATDVRTGNTLNVFTTGITVKNIANFQHYNFVLPTNGATVLTLTDTAGADLTGALAGSSVAVPYASSGHALRVGQAATLLKGAGTLTTTNLALNKGQVRQGVSLVYDYTLAHNTAANSIEARITHVQAVPESKALSESRAASLGFANMGADLIAGAGLTNARSATASGKGLSGGDSTGQWGLAPFFALSASDMRYNTGSHTDVAGMALMAGLAKTWQTPAADVLAGVFFEAAFGDYKAHNTFGSGSVNGKGDTQTVGGGILARVDMTDTALKGLYAEASFRIGSLTSDYHSNDLRNIAGNTASYDQNNTYYGAHAGLGYIWNLTDSASLDLYGKYFWTHQTGQNATIFGDAFNFKAMDSHRVKLGGRFSYAITETLAPYIGAAWEHELDGEARATTYGHDVPAPSLKGSTGVGEIGINWNPEKAQGFSVEMGLQGYTGQREGVSGTLQLKYEF